MIEAFHTNDQSMFSSYQLIFQLSNISFICRFSKVVCKDVHKGIKEHHTDHIKLRQWETKVKM